MIEKKKTRQWVLVEEIENGGLWCAYLISIALDAEQDWSGNE